MVLSLPRLNVRKFLSEGFFIASERFTEPARKFLSEVIGIFELVRYKFAHITYVALRAAVSYALMYSKILLLQFRYIIFDENALSSNFLRELKPEGNAGVG